MFSHEAIRNLKQAAARHHGRTGLPLVTLSYAQSIDGSITHQRGEPLALSGPESMLYTHKLRDMNDAILVGIGTVLADDPRLTVRSIRGTDPQPVILDSRLRFPADARLWSHPRAPWIFVGPHAETARRALFEARGAVIHEIPSASGRYLELHALLQKLGELGVTSLMVEGGASVITSFLSGHLVDQVVITIAPLFVGGVRLLEERLEDMPDLSELESIQLGRDIVLFGSFARQAG